MLVTTDDTYYKGIANAIRKKTGSEETYLPSEMEGKIEDIGDKWIRPKEWSQYTQDMIANTEVLYFTLDIRGDIVPVCFMTQSPLQTSGVKMFLGNVVDGVFTPIVEQQETTRTVASTLIEQRWEFVVDKTLFSGNYIAVKVVPTEGSQILTYSFPRRRSVYLTDGSRIYMDYGEQPVVEVFGRLPNCILSGSDAYNCFTVPKKTRSFEIHDAKTGGNLTFGGAVYEAPFAIENIQLINIDGERLKSLQYFLCETNIRDVTLDIANVKNVTDMSYAFGGISLKNLDLTFIDTSKVTTFRDIFENSAIDTLDVSTWNTSNVTNMREAFKFSRIETLDLSSWNFEKVTDMADFFGQQQIGASTIIFPDNTTHTNGENSWQSSNDCKLAVGISSNFRGYKIRKFINNFFVLYDSFSVQYCFALGHDSLMNIINSLPTIDTTKTITIGTDNKKFLSDSEIAIATDKGWSVA